MDDQIAIDVAELVDDLLLSLEEEENLAPPSTRDFAWEPFLLSTGLVAVEPSAFTHVDKSLDDGIPPNAVVLLRSNPLVDGGVEPKFWPAQFQSVLGKSAKLSFVGTAEEAPLDIWINLDSVDRDILKPLNLEDLARDDIDPPPCNTDAEVNADALKELRDSFEDDSIVTWQPEYLDKQESFLPIDRLRIGQYIEVLDEVHPDCIHMAEIRENLGGRLLLRYHFDSISCEDFWLFWLSERLHFLGWGLTNEAKIFGCSYEVPEIAEIVQTLSGPPLSVFKHQLALEEHNFSAKMKLEVLDWTDPSQFRPATVVEVINDFFFAVEMDGLLDEHNGSPRRICHRLSTGLFPTNWCRANGLRLTPPPGYVDPEFQWFSYLRQEDADAVPSSGCNIPRQTSKFRKGQVLEVVNPLFPDQICAATITKIVGHLLWIHFDNYRHPTAAFIVDSRSCDLFPCGWCGANGYPLSSPVQRSSARDSHSKFTQMLYTSKIDSFGCERPSIPYMPPHLYPRKGQEWTPRIYVNHNCVAGPFLCRTRIADMPKYWGPGPIKVVLPKLMSMLLSTSYRPKHSLLEVQPDCTNPNPSRDVVVVKVKGPIEICHERRQVPAYLRHMCVLLECCPSLLSINRYPRKCPADCHRLLKTNVIAPLKPIQTAGTKQPRHTRADANMFEQAKLLLDEDEDSRDNMDSQDGFTRRSRRRPSILLHLDSKKVVTRGVKLQSFAFATRTRKRKVSEDSNELEENKRIATTTPVTNRSALIDQNVRIDVVLPKVESNPRHWSCSQVVNYIRETEAASLASILRNEQIDGEAFLLLNLPAVQQHLRVNLGPAIKLCKIVERLKLAFVEFSIQEEMSTRLDDAIPPQLNHF